MKGWFKGRKGSKAEELPPPQRKVSVDDAFYAGATKTKVLGGSKRKKSAALAKSPEKAEADAKRAQV